MGAYIKESLPHGSRDLEITVGMDSALDQVEYVEQVRGDDKPFVRVMSRRAAYGLLFNQMMKLTLAGEAFTYDQDKGLVWDEDGYIIHAFVAGI
ncbi:MAG: hypothetical protein EON54_15505 [Alcaligenaceae bacterium]|nr:MAG: hypothetical protein EON54_15505 [Alcaligenaceae bacterium]